MLYYELAFWETKEKVYNFTTMCYTLQRLTWETNEKVYNFTTMCYTLQMANIKEMKEYTRTGTNLYYVIKKMGKISPYEAQPPLSRMTNEAAVQMTMRWLAERRGKGRMMQLRLHNKTKTVMHYVGMRAYTKRAWFLCVHDLRLKVVSERMCGNPQPHATH